MEKEPRLVDYPCVLVRFRCRHCRRAGQSRLVRLAEKYGADLSLEELLDIVSASCPIPRRPAPGRPARKYRLYCGIYLPDFEQPPPRSGGGAGLVLIQGKGDAA